jgi:hypothetical protein
VTTWAALQSYVRANYKVVSEREGQLAVLLELDGMRSQQASIDLEVLGDREWVCIASGIGLVGEIDVTRALEVIDSRIFGAIGRAGQFYTVKHSALLSDMNAEELDYPLVLTLSLADEIESKLGLGDRF